VKNIVGKIVSSLGNTKATPIGPFFFHLYDYLGTLRSAEKVAYKAASTMLKLKITPPREREMKDRKGGPTKKSSKGSLER